MRGCGIAMTPVPVVGICSPKQLFEAQRSRKGPSLPHGRHTLGGWAPFRTITLHSYRQGGRRREALSCFRLRP